MPKAELRRRLDEAISEADRIIAGLDRDGLLRTTDRVGGPFTVAELLLRMSHHWAVHTGQIVYAANAFRAGAFDDPWNGTLPR